LDKQDTKRQEQAMIGRICGATLALLCFAAVCLNGLREGNSFGSVMGRSLVALVVGGATGLAAAAVVRRIIQDEFNRTHRRDSAADGAAPKDKAAARSAAERKSEPAGSTAGSAAR